MPFKSPNLGNNFGGVGLIALLMSSGFCLAAPLTLPPITAPPLNMAQQALLQSKGKQRAAVIAQMEAAGLREGWDMVLPLVQDADASVVAAAQHFISRFENAVPPTQLKSALLSPSPFIRRHALTALGLRPQDPRPAIQSLLTDSAAEVRQTAIGIAVQWGDHQRWPQLLEHWSLLGISEQSQLLSKLRNFQLAPLLEQRENPTTETGISAIHLLGQVKNPTAIPHLKPLLQHPTPRVRYQALGALWLLQALDAEVDLLPLVQDPDAEIQTMATAMLNQAYVAVLTPKLLKLLMSPQPEVRLAAVNILGHSNDRRICPDLFPLVQDPDVRVRQQAVIALHHMAYARPPRLLMYALKDPDPDVRWLTLQAVKELGNAQQVSEILPYLKDPDANVQQAAVDLLAHWQNPAALPALKALWEKSAGEPDTAILKAFSHIPEGSQSALMHLLTAPQSSAKTLARLKSNWDRQILLDVLAHWSAAQDLPEAVAMEILTYKSDYTFVNASDTPLKGLTTVNPVIQLWAMAYFADGCIAKPGSVVFGLGECQTAFARIKQLSQSALPTVKSRAIQVVKAWQLPVQTAQLRQDLKTFHPPKQRLAIQAVYQMNLKALQGDLLPLLNIKVAPLQVGAFEALWHLESSKAWPDLLAAFKRALPPSSLPPTTPQMLTYAVHLAQSGQTQPLLDLLLVLGTQTQSQPEDIHASILPFLPQTWAPAIQQKLVHSVLTWLQPQNAPLHILALNLLVRWSHQPDPWLPYLKRVGSPNDTALLLTQIAMVQQLQQHFGHLRNKHALQLDLLPHLIQWDVPEPEEVALAKTILTFLAPTQLRQVREALRQWLLYNRVAHENTQQLTQFRLAMARLLKVADPAAQDYLTYIMQSQALPSFLQKEARNWYKDLYPNQELPITIPSQ